MNHYVLQVGRHRLRLGTRLDLSETPTARQVVESLDTLLEAVCLRLGDDVDRRPLLQSMANTLAIAGREACLPLATLDFPDPLRRELTRQADRIGRAIAQWATGANATGVARSRVPRHALERLELRSRCDGHPWTEDATRLLTGERGGPPMMQLYNEWLHQLVLLRDALLPFENWERVPLPFNLHEGRGLRRVEPARDAFLAGFLTRIATHASLVRYARALFDPAEVSGEDDIYGVQTELGLLLPSVIGRDDIGDVPKGLLTWHPAVVARPEPGRTLVFRCAFADYFAAPRSPLGPSSGPEPIDGGAIVAEGTTLWLNVRAGRHTYRVDLGQCLRGQRFAYRPAAVVRAQEPSAVTRHDSSAVLRQAGLVTAEAGIHVLDSGGDPLLALALLGKIYPENVVLAGNAPWSAVLGAGKGYGAKFVLVAGDDLALGADIGKGPHRLVEQAAEG